MQTPRRHGQNSKEAEGHPWRQWERRCREARRCEGADDGAGEGEGSLPTEDDVSAPQTEDDNQAQLAVPDAADVHDDEAQLLVFEALDKALTCEYCLSRLTSSQTSLSACSYLTVDDVEARRYPGFSKIRRLELDYRREHPEVSVVGVARVREADDDDLL